MGRDDTYTYRLQRYWDELCQAAGVQDVALVRGETQFVVAPPGRDRSEEKLMNSNETSQFTLDMSRFLCSESGKEAANRAQWITPLGSGYNAAAYTLQAIFEQMLPRMKAIQTRP